MESLAIKNPRGPITSQSFEFVEETVHFVECGQTFITQARCHFLLDPRYVGTGVKALTKMLFPVISARGNHVNIQ